MLHRTKYFDKKKRGGGGEEKMACQNLCPNSTRIMPEFPDFPRILPEFCSNIVQILPELEAQFDYKLLYELHMSNKYLHRGNW